MKTIDYKGGNKNQFRRTQWSRVRERVPNPSDSVVLYLPGEQNLDVAVAQRHGFKPLNMIAVEHCPRTLRLLRDSGQLTIDGDIFEVIDCWDFFGPRVGVLILDLCNGYKGAQVATLMRNFLGKPAFYGTVVGVNLLRGRERDAQDKEFACYHEDAKDRHRGLMFLTSMAQAIVESFTDFEFASKEYRLLVNKLTLSCTPSLPYSYKSIVRKSTQYYDSIVFKNNLMHGVPPEISLYVTKCLDGWHADAGNKAKTKPLRSRIAATLAHRTRRK